MIQFQILNTLGPNIYFSADNHLLLHSLGYNIQLHENAKMGAIVVSVSFLRGYYIRRIFNKIVRRVYETT